MGHNVQSQAGESLTDLYDVRGGQAPIERIETAIVATVHEMGDTILSERFSSFMRRNATGDLTQGTNWDIVLTDLPPGVSRILGLSVFSDNSNVRLSVATVSVRDPLAGGGGREMPIFAWAAADGLNREVRIVEEGGSPGAAFLLVQPESWPLTPTLLVGPGQPQQVGEIAFRGRTSAFGAGTVNLSMVLHLAFAAIGGISSHGLPVPSW